MNSSNLLIGIPAAPGITIGKAFLFVKEVEEVKPLMVDNVDEAIFNLEEAIKKSKKELDKIFNIAAERLGTHRASIFEAHMMILDDEILISTIKDRIRNEKLIPEYLVNNEISKYQKLMNNSKEEYLRERSFDIEDIKNRIIKNLKKKKWMSKISEDSIVVAENLTPADTVLFTRVNVKAFVTNFGGLTSHTAILSRSLNIPAVVGLHDATMKIANEDELIVDGFNGQIIVNPTKEQKLFYQKRIEEVCKLDEELKKLKNLNAETLDGVRIQLFSNLDLDDEVENVLKNGADGIGLVRTEQIFSEFDSFPDEEKQFEIYKRLSDKMYPSKVIIRVLDVGGDKVLPLDVQEPNPFLGWRGIRFLLDNKEVLKNQIKAILRASVNNNLMIMVPMITSMEEIDEFLIIVDECKIELKGNNKNFSNSIPIGIMIEVPSAAILAKEMSAKVNFFSIGTNDLIQYTLAVDRGNDIISSLYQEFHPAVVRTLKSIIDNSPKKDFFVSICGQMAADPIAVPLLIGLGFKNLSVSSFSLPNIKRIIRGINSIEVAKLADECLTFSSEKEIRNLLNEFFNKNLKVAED